MKLNISDESKAPLIYVQKILKHTKKTRHIMSVLDTHHSRLLIIMFP